jgi:diguanylate cyclase (GGDEF)-like protein
MFSAVGSTESAESYTLSDRLAGRGAMKDPNDTRDIGPRVGSPLWFHITACTVAGAVAFGLTMTHLTGLSRLVGYPQFWVLATMIVLGDIWPIVTPGRSNSEAPVASVAFSLGALFACGLPVALLLRAASCFGVCVAERKSLHRAAFNAAAVTLSTVAAWAVLYGLGVRPSGLLVFKPPGERLWWWLLAGLVFFAVHYVVIATAVSMHAREPIGRTVRRTLGYQSFVNICLIGTAPLVAIAIESGSALVLLLFAFPFAAIYVNAAISVQREHQAHHDELTGLSNRKLLVSKLESTLAQASISGTKVGFLLLDLDRGLKEVNDTLGHAVGDRLLRLVAHRLTHSIRPGDFVARLGGDEFAVLLPAVREAGVAREVAARLRAAVAEPIRLEGMSFVIEVSIGIAMYPDDATSGELLMQRADVAMYLAKQRRSGVERYVAELDRNSPSRLALFGDLRRGLDRGELELHYQPKVNLADRRVVGMEALVRWQHPERGVVPPSDFIPQVQQSYLMREVTAFVIDSALRQAAQWQQSGMGVQVSLNVSGRDLLDSGLADLVAEGLSRHKLAPDALLLEIDERVLTSEPAHAVATAEALSEIGVALSLDDFGTGYSSLVRLKRLPVTEVKVDASFVGRLLESPDDLVVVKSIVDLAAALGIRSVAEGVESADIAAALLGMGCVAGQGWHFCKPLNSASATAWLAEHGDAADRKPRPVSGHPPSPRRPVVMPPSGWLV